MTEKMIRISISVPKELHSELEKMKIHDNQALYEVIQGMIDYCKISKKESDFKKYLMNKR